VSSPWDMRLLPLPFAERAAGYAEWSEWAWGGGIRIPESGARESDYRVVASDEEIERRTISGETREC